MWNMKDLPNPLCLTTYFSVAIIDSYFELLVRPGVAWYKIHCQEELLQQK